MQRKGQKHLGVRWRQTQVRRQTKAAPSGGLARVQLQHAGPLHRHRPRQRRPRVMALRRAALQGLQPEGPVDESVCICHRQGNQWSSTPCTLGRHGACTGKQGQSQCFFPPPPPPKTLPALYLVGRNVQLLYDGVGVLRGHGPPVDPENRRQPLPPCTSPLHTNLRAGTGSGGRGAPRILLKRGTGLCLPVTIHPVSMILGPFAQVQPMLSAASMSTSDVPTTPFPSRMCVV